MLVCNVSLRPPHRAISSEIAEVAAALDVLGTGNVVFATLVDDPASVNEIVDAYLGEIMVEVASATDVITVPMVYAATIVEAVTAAETSDATAAAIPWTPASLTTLKGWYKADLLAGADASNVSTWPDSSGLGNTATPSGSGGMPQLQTAEQNGLNIVEFTYGFNTHFSLPNLLSGASAAAAVIVLKSTTTGQGSPFGFGTDTAANHYPYSDNSIYDGFGSTARKTVGAPGGLSSWHLASFHSAAGSWKYYKNGTQFFATSTNTVGISSTPYIGRSGASPIYFAGMIGEIVAVNEFLSDADRQKIEGYLAWKWALAGSLDVSHPYKSAPP